MPKYLLQLNYSAEGIKGVLGKGGSERESVGRKAVESVGGKLESLHFAFGDTDAYAICDLPDNTAAAALAMTLSATGRISARTVVLLTPAELDAVVGHQATYTPPGS
jgi:uncharacterized protein with GYD domain